MSTVIIVDSNVEDRLKLGGVVASLGHTPRYGDTGTAALELVRKSRPVLLIIDSSAPGTNGLQVCRALKGEAVAPPFPVILVTPLDGLEAVRLWGSKQGATDFLTKPFMDNDVSATVLRYAGRGTDKVALPANGTGPHKVNGEQEKQITVALAVHLGPFAGVLLEREMAKLGKPFHALSPVERAALVRALGSHIPDQEGQQAFADAVHDLR